MSYLVNTLVPICDVYVFFGEAHVCGELKIV